MENVEAILQSLNNKYYASELRQVENSEVLYVIMSPKARFFCYNVPFSNHVLFLSDKKINYYLIKPVSHTKIIRNLAHELKVKKVVFIGSSKGAFGALLWSSLIHSKHNHFKTYSLAFSPMTMLYPFNSNLQIPSYKKLIDLISSDNPVHEALRYEAMKYGNLREIVPKFNVPTKIVYPDSFEMDKVEALELRGANITYHAVPLSVHGAINHFMIPRDNPEEFKRVVRKLYENSKQDEDLSNFLSTSEEQLTKELLDYNPPSFDKYILDFIEM